MKPLAVLLFSTALGLTACQQSAPQAVESETLIRTISGSITYRERLALSDRAIVEVRLLDVSLADAPARVIASREIPDPGQVPIRFELPFSSGEIDPRRAYAIQARIFDRGELQFINDTRVPVLTRGAGDRVRITLVLVQNTQSAEPTESAYEV